MIVVFTGVRPQFIKALHLARELLYRGEASLFGNLWVIDTGQHYDNFFRHEADELAELLDSRFIRIFDDSSYKFDCSDSVLDDLIFSRLGLKTAISCVIVFGDADPGVIGASFAQRHSFKLIHIEAGGRRNEKEREHKNSVFIDSIADYAFCVTQEQVQNLRKEGFKGKSYWAGDLAFESMQRELHKAEASNRINHIWQKNFGSDNFDLSGRILVSTIHRPHNTRLAIVKGIHLAANKVDAAHIFVEHPRNKIFKKQIKALGCFFVEPLSNIDTLVLLRAASLLITDSGGLIREANHIGRSVIGIGTHGGWPQVFEKGMVNVQLNEVTKIKEYIERLLKLNEKKDLRDQSATYKNLLLNPKGMDLFIFTLKEMV